MKSLVRPRPIGGSALVRDYLQERPSSFSFYGSSPFELGSFRAKLREVSGRFGSAERQRVAAAVRPTTASAARRLERFVAEGGAVITTGQQAGFLTGPLYTIHKALSAVVLARHLEERLGIIVLPVFWIASEDHDWAEVNHATLIDSKGSLRRFELEGSDPRPLPMTERRLEGELDILCDEIMEAVGGGEHGREQANRIVSPYRRPGRSIAEAFGEAFAALFSEIDLLVTDAAAPAVKRGSISILGAALTDSRGHESILESRTEAITAAGYTPQVRVLEGATNVFYRTSHGRERLYRVDGGFGVRGHQKEYAAEELLAQLVDEPERFSPNVFLRPVVESAIFPTLAYVGGPGEVAYFAQVGALFGQFGMSPPVVVPRFSGLVVEPSVERVLEKLDMGVDDLGETREALVEQVARREVPEKLKAYLHSMRGGLSGGFEQLIEEAARLDPTLAASLGSIRDRTLAEMGRADRKIVRSVKRREGSSLKQMDRVLDALRPNGAPQDRVLNVLPYVGRYANHFLREVERAIQEGWRLPEEG